MKYKPIFIIIYSILTLGFNTIKPLKKVTGWKFQVILETQQLKLVSSEYKIKSIDTTSLSQSFSWHNLII